MVYKEFNFGGKSSPLGSFGAMIVLAIFLIALFYIAKGIFTILYYASPVLLILAAIFDYTVITDYGKFILNLFKRNILYGLIATVLTVFAFPVVSGFLFFRAYARKSMKSYQKAQEPRFDDYEEVQSDDISNEFIDLKRLEQNKVSKDIGGEYDNLFK
ncbi:MAG TPA: hypothetical protein PKD85_13320 [Saprospiraceae bacterium]|nr:hypothetical protein [Saprospiraceae bacterium]